MFPESGSFGLAARMGKKTRTPLATVPGKVLHTLATLGHWAFIALRRRWYRTDRSVSGAADRLASCIRRDGFVAVEGFIDGTACATLRHRIDELMQTRADGAVPVADQRIVSAETDDDRIDDFLKSDLPRNVAEAFFGNVMVPAYCEAARILPIPGQQGSGGSWHRDSFFREIKAILYLSDVGEEDGPYEFFPGSERLGDVIAGIWRDGLKFRQNRLSDGDADRQIARRRGAPVSVCGTAGTLILCNTATMHRGRPCRRFPRYSLTSNYFESFTYTPRRLARFGVPYRPDRLPQGS